MSRGGRKEEDQRGGSMAASPRVALELEIEKELGFRAMREEGTAKDGK